ncbi:hypothetical protein FOA43_000344 [Brettanomyces nanus]|uniref:Uncharacterized protein n=1 Tax=Eeniella nana TaxID=13502 RepID=A0A875RN08_EENNA|nr:uncharacterized protein FOA43_000344 [Brettanomyces nanus]QPG73040.1 hypothetical protein FOA43_000344 [Brettanomyces nanus]
MSEQQELPKDIRKVVGPYIKRANELERFQPIIAYFAKMYSAQIILEGQYHLKSQEVANYTESLLNEIESSRNELEKTSDQIADVLADKEKSFKMVLGFSNVIFNKADKQVQTHNCSKQTALDFKASIDFYNLLQLWSELFEAEREGIEKRIKYAKFQCARILKSMKMDEDPNEYVTADDEAELANMENNSRNTSTVDSSATTPETTTSQLDLLDTPSVIRNETEKPFASELTLTKVNLELPKPPADIEGEINLPVAPVLIKGEKNSLGLPSAPIYRSPKNNLDHKSTTSKSTNEDELESPSKQKPNVKSDATERKVKLAHPHNTSGPAIISTPVQAVHPKSKDDVDEIWQQEEVISHAQKRARFAISALNYEDISTAISELEAALKLLRGS